MTEAHVHCMRSTVVNEGKFDEKPEIIEGNDEVPVPSAGADSTSYDAIIEEKKVATTLDNGNENESKQPEPQELELTTEAAPSSPKPILIDDLFDVPILEATLVDEDGDNQTEREQTSLHITIEPTGPVYDAVLMSEQTFCPCRFPSRLPSRISRRRSVVAGLMVIVCAFAAPMVGWAVEKNPPGAIDSFNQNIPLHTNLSQSGASAEAMTFELADGRTLAYCQYGLQHTRPYGREIKTVLHNNGNGRSRLEWPGDEFMLSFNDINFISVDRPGHGLSDPQPNRTLLGWADDIRQLVDHLNVDQFYVEGWATGGPYALAVAHELPDRVIKGALLNSIAPYDMPNPYEGLQPQIQEMVKNAREGNFGALLAYHKPLADSVRTLPDEQIGFLVSMACEGVDCQEVTNNTDLQKLYGASIKEGYKQGIEGPARDDMIVNTPWGFQLQDIHQHFDIWQGTVGNTPQSHGVYLASNLQDSQLILLDDTSDMFPLTRWEEILLELIDDGDTNETEQMMSSNGTQFAASEPQKADIEPTPTAEKTSTSTQSSIQLPNEDTATTTAKNPTMQTGGPFTVQGFMWIDLNENGHYDRGEPPAAWAFANLRQCDDKWIQTTSNIDESGQYQFIGVEEGEYYVEFYRPSNNYEFTSPMMDLDDKILNSNAENQSGKSPCIKVDSNFSQLINAGYVPKDTNI